MSDMVGLHAALSGLRAAQAGIDTATHNVANVSTPGYTRQRADLATRAPYESVHGPAGSGVDVAGLSRARDAMADARVRSGGAALGEAAARAALLAGLEAATGEPGGGVAAALGEMWAAFEELALDPSSAPARTATLATLDGLASEVRRLAAAWDARGAEAAATLAAHVDEVNALAVEVAGLNEAIVAAAGSGAPNDLADRRDAAVDRLSELVGATVVAGPGNAVRVSVGGLALVDGVHAGQLALDPITHTVLHPSGAAVEAGGAVGGTASFLTDDLPAHQAALDAFTVALADQLNAAHSAGWSSATTPGGDLFAYDPARPAASLVAAITDPSQLATAATPGPPFPVFDGGNAAALAGLRTAPALGAETLDGAWRAVVTGLGAAAAGARRTAESRDALHAAAELARAGAHGVSLDEEMAHLLRFQRAYEAAARVMTAVDEALEVLVRRTGLVGR